MLCGAAPILAQLLLEQFCLSVFIYHIGFKSKALLGCYLPKLLRFRCIIKKKAMLHTNMHKPQLMS